MTRNARPEVCKPAPSEPARPDPDPSEADRLKRLIDRAAANLPAVAELVDFDRLRQRCGLEHVPRRDFLLALAAADTAVGDRLGIRYAVEGRLRCVYGGEAVRERFEGLHEADRAACVRTIFARPLDSDASTPVPARIPCRTLFNPTRHLRNPLADPDHRAVILAALGAIGDAKPGDVPAVELRAQWWPCLSVATRDCVPWVHVGDGDAEAALQRWYVRACWELVAARLHRRIGDGDAPLEAVSDWLDDPTPGRRLVAIAASQQTDAATPADRTAVDVPDAKGCVLSPVDATAYIPASDILRNQVPDGLSISDKRLSALCDSYGANKIRWTRPLTQGGTPDPHRRLVHVGDALACFRRLLQSNDGADTNPTPRDIEELTARLRPEKLDPDGYEGPTDAELIRDKLARGTPNSRK